MIARLGSAAGLAMAAIGIWVGLDSLAFAGLAVAAVGVVLGIRRSDD